MKTKREKKKVFISYAREDQAQAEKIHQYLSDANFDPWMDVHDLVPGDDWLKSITRAIKQAEYFLAILSHNSVDKPGVLQEELDIALKICKKIPDPEIFLIPVRLEECETPEKISQYQWVNLFAEDGWVRLLRALHQERRKSRNWNRRFMASLTGMLIVVSFMTWKVAFQAPNSDSTLLYENACKASTLPLKVGFARLKDCPVENWSTLDGMWESETVQITPLEQSISSSQDARALTGYDLVIWGSCNDQNTLQFELVSSRKPDEIYEPTSLQATGTLTEVGDVGEALISYQRGEYAEAAQQFDASKLAAGSPELELLRSNSLMFAGKYEDAISVLKDTVLLQVPTWGAVYNNLGIALFNREELKKKSGYNFNGLPEFDQAIQYATAENDTETLLLAYTNKGDLLRRSSNWEDAESACKAALQSSAQSSLPYFCLARYKLARIAGSSSDISYTEIQDDLTNGERFGLPPAKIYILQGNLYKMQHQKKEALAEYEHFLNLMQNRACLQVDWSYINDTAGYITMLKH